MRYSKQCNLVRQAVEQCGDHPTADRVYQKVRSVYPRISLGTVYRNLAQLSLSGSLLQISGFPGADHYDHNTAPHAHFCCDRCGALHDVAVRDLREQRDEIERDTGHKITSVQITIRGICNDCEHNVND